ncbi:FG-GAP repeat domain-containing protein [Urbifossiella limnaea]|uniref:FG-GAP repeat protein n=1 Tax=Urbifossiella limnaea TaxID=2528023 RepID=A0A517Y1B8_9BACT|nr:VCBS repeat-containing protein [Urbifossiella limnaea]QDU23566.1 FG-GAP repeat protein [Urbifossiella limnaea]
MPVPAAYSRFARLLALRDRLADLFARRPGAPSARLTAEALEDRVVPDGGRPLPLPVIYAGAGEGMAPVVKAYDAETSDLNFTRTVYESTFTGGVRVAVGDFTLDGYPDVVVAPGPGGGPRVRVLDGKTGDEIGGPLGSFWAFDSAFTGGVHVAAADVDGDYVPDVVAAAGPGGGPHLRVFSGATGAEIASFYPYDPDFDGGITVAAADLTGDGKAEVAVGAGAGGGPRVRVYDPTTWDEVAGPLGSFFAFDPAFGGGVYLGADALAGDYDADGTPDLAVGSGPGMAGTVTVLSGATGGVLRTFQPFGSEYEDGVRVALCYADDDEYADVVAGTGPGGAATIRVFSGATGLQLPDPTGEYQPFGTGAGSEGGVFVAASNDPTVPEPIYPIVFPSPVAPGVTFLAFGGVYDPTGVRAPTGTLTFYAFPLGSPGSTVSLGSVALHGIGGVSSAAAVRVRNGLNLPAGSYTVYFVYSGDAYFTARTSPMHGQSIGGVGSATAPGDTSCLTGLLNNILQDPIPGSFWNPDAYTKNPVRYADGVAVIAATDLESDGFGRPWGQARTWSNNPAYSAGSDLGNGWVSGTQPHLVRSGSSLVLLSSAVTAHYYDGQGTPDGDGNYATYAPRFTDTTAVTYDATNDEFVVADAGGNVLRFYDFGSGRPADERGSLKSHADAAGNLTAVVSANSDGQPTEVRRSAGRPGRAGRRWTSPTSTPTSRPPTRSPVR